MKTTWIVAAAISLSAGSLVAQDRPQSSTAVPPIPPAGNQTVQITGCVARGDASAAADTSRPAAASSGEEFFLANARMSNDSPTGTAVPSKEDPRENPSAAAASGAADTKGAGVRYKLNSGSTAMAPHLGHQVEITGRLDPPLSATAGAVGTSGTSAPQTLRVESVKMIAASCSETR